MLNYNDYTFNKKLNEMFIINEGMNWLSDNEVEWTDEIESIIPKTNINFWNIINSFTGKYKGLINKIIIKIIKLIRNSNITTGQIAKLINKISDTFTSLIPDLKMRKRAIYISLTLIIGLTAMSMSDIIDNDNINQNVIEVASDFGSEQSITDTQDSEIVDNTTVPTNDKDLNDFLYKLAFKESTNTWDTVRYVKRKRDNKTIPAYVGKYQFGNLAFRDIDSDIRVKDFAEDPSIWTEEQQDKDIMKLLDNNRHYLRKKIGFKGYHHYLGETINGIKITESGVLAASHLVGYKNVKKFLRSDGEKDYADGNGTKCSYYMNEFSGYKTK